MAEQGQAPQAQPSGLIATPITTMSAPILPTLPDPNSFWSQPGPSSLFLLQEARANVNTLNDLKTHIQSGYNTPPPRLPPLPPIPRPSTSTIHTPRSSSAVKPIERPELPLKWKGKARADCLVEFQDEEWIAEEKYHGRAIQIKGPGMTVWVTMSGEVIGIGEVKVFVEYRIPHLPHLVTQACFYCLKYLKMPDGLPNQHTGFLAHKGDGSQDEKAAEIRGKWVCWHASCGES